MKNISPINRGAPIVPHRGGNARVQSRTLINENGTTPSETINGERNARATDAAARQSRSSTTGQDGRGGNLDIVS